jgi:predicted transcriptional regulator
MSPRAAWRLDAFGFAESYDYVGGKADWLAAGLATDGAAAATPRAGRWADRTVPTCGPDEMVGEVAERARLAGWDTCVVVNKNNVVAGRLRRSAMEGNGSARVEGVMQVGPTTIRADTPLDQIMDRLREQKVHDVIVTSPDGELIGLLCREDPE